MRGGMGRRRGRVGWGDHRGSCHAKKGEGGTDWRRKREGEGKMGFHSWCTREGEGLDMVLQALVICCAPHPARIALAFEIFLDLEKIMQAACVVGSNGRGCRMNARRWGRHCSVC